MPSVAPPLMTEAEALLYTVPFEDVATVLRSTLERHGVAIVTGVLTVAEQQAAYSDFEKDLQRLVFGVSQASGAKPRKVCAGTTKAGNRCRTTADATGHAFQAARPLRLGQDYCSRHMPRPQMGKRPRQETTKEVTWSAEAMKEIAPKGSCPFFGLPHGSFSWNCRRAPKVRGAFAAALGTDDLVSSLDVPFFVHRQAPPKKSNACSAHVDENVSLGQTEGYTYQGILYVPGVGEDSSATVVWPGSHKDEVYGRVMKGLSKKQNGHYVLLSGLEKNSRELLQEWQGAARRARAPAGSLLLWSTRTVHMPWGSGHRLAQAVCMEPRSRRSSRALFEKLNLAAKGLPSTHWASLGLEHVASLAGETDRALVPNGSSELIEVFHYPKRHRSAGSGCDDAEDDFDQQILLQIVPEDWQRLL
jgi:hypothetical protein